MTLSKLEKPRALGLSTKVSYAVIDGVRELVSSAPGVPKPTTPWRPKPKPGQVPAPVGIEANNNPKPGQHPGKSKPSSVPSTHRPSTGNPGTKPSDKGVWGNPRNN